MRTEELKRLHRVIDMMITMHSVLRDRYGLKSIVLDIALISLSTLINATVFVDPSFLTFLHINTKLVQIILGMSSVLVFAASIISFRVDWKALSWQHQQAAEILSKLKSQTKLLLTAVSDNVLPGGEFELQYQLILSSMNDLPIKIPDKEFAKLKAFHRRKIEVSKLADKYPGSSAALLYLFVWYRSNLNLMFSKGDYLDE